MPLGPSCSSLAGHQRELPGHVSVHLSWNWEGGELEEFKLMMCARSSSASALLQEGITLFLVLCSILLNYCFGYQLCVCRAAFTHTHTYAPRTQKAGLELLQ